MKAFYNDVFGRLQSFEIDKQPSKQISLRKDFYFNTMGWLFYDAELFVVREKNEKSQNQ